MNMFADPAKIAQAQIDLWTEGLAIWQRALGRRWRPSTRARRRRPTRTSASPRRNGASNPLFDMIRQTYLLVSERLLGSVDAIEGLDEKHAREDALHDAAASSTRWRRPISR